MPYSLISNLNPRNMFLTFPLNEPRFLLDNGKYLLVTSSNVPLSRSSKKCSLSILAGSIDLRKAIFPGKMDSNLVSSHSSLSFTFSKYATPFFELRRIIDVPTLLSRLGSTFSIPQ